MNTHRKLAEVVLAHLRQPHDYAKVEYPMYHDFGKYRFPDSLLEQWCAHLAIEVSQWQVEIVVVRGDLTQERHYHAHANAFVVVLGHQEGFPEPQNFEKYIGGQWVISNAGDQIEIPAGEVHGFTVRPDATGIGYFLTIQTPPIVGGEGMDDYVLDV